MQAWSNLVPSLTGIRLGGILGRPQVIADRNHGEKDDQQHDQGDQVQSPLRARPMLEANPETEAPDRKEGPGEIEENFHPSHRFYTTVVGRREIDSEWKRVLKLQVDIR
jgi:hypothetical protein